MTDNAVKTREARVLWGAVKSAALRRGDSLLDGLAGLALDAWATSDAGTKLSEDRATREAFVASLVGAAVVDATLDKLASEGAYTTPEVEFLRDLNAEAALRDLARFQKNAGLTSSLLSALKNHPAAVGAGVGGLAGAGFGAYADDDDRLRGALRFGLPGVAMGAMLGHGAGQLRAEMRESRAADKAKALADKAKALDSTRAQELHDARLKALELQARARKRSAAERARDEEIHAARMALMKAQTAAAGRANRPRRP